MNRQTLAARVRALLAKTSENGATEAEALAAAEKARELMDKYHLDHGALGMEEEGTRKSTTFPPRGRGSREGGRIHNEIKKPLCFSIGKFCDCRVWTTNYTLINFLGLQSDVDFAEWLLSSLTTFVVNQTSLFQLDAVLDGLYCDPSTRLSFQVGAVERIKERLNELATSRANLQSASTGTSLIVLKNQLVERHFKKLGLRLAPVSYSAGTISNSSAYSAGRAAGDRASFGRPVTAPKSRQITHQ